MIPVSHTHTHTHTRLHTHTYTHTDLRHICQNLDQFGHGKGTIYGGCSEYTIIPAKYAYLLQTSIGDQEAAILERMCKVFEPLTSIRQKLAIAYTVEPSYVTLYQPMTANAVMTFV